MTWCLLPCDYGPDFDVHLCENSIKFNQIICTPCSCVQSISATLCEENIMFWEVSGIGTEVIGLLWNLPFLEYLTGLFFLGLFLPLIVPSGSLLLSDSVLFSVSCF